MRRRLDQNSEIVLSLITSGGGKFAPKPLKMPAFRHLPLSKKIYGRCLRFSGYLDELPIEAAIEAYLEKTVN